MDNLPCVYCHAIHDADGQVLRHICWKWDLPRQCFPALTCRLCDVRLPRDGFRPICDSELSPRQIRRGELALTRGMAARAERITMHPCCDTGPAIGAFSASERAWLDRLGIG